MANVDRAVVRPGKSVDGLLWAVALAGLVALGVFLRQPSEPGSSVWLGYSLPRLAVAAALLAAVAALFAAAAAELARPAWWLAASRRVAALLAGDNRRFALLATLFALICALVALLALTVAPVAGQLTQLITVRASLGIPLAWGLLVLLLAVARLARGRPAGGAELFFTPLRLAVLFAILMGIYAAALWVEMHYTWDIRMRGMESYLFLPAALFLTWGWLHGRYREQAWYGAVHRALRFAALGVVVFAVYRHTAQWMDWQNSPSKSYWPELAAAFLNGRLYLLNPMTTHDLTFYQGNWYVPNPPLPALVLMPFVAVWGAGINTVLFSIVVGAINAMLLFALLEEASAQGLIPTGTPANLLLSALVAFGTPHWWLSIMGRMWFLSQLLTLTCTALAALLALRRASPWWVGACLGLAVLSRPNAFTIWPFVFGLALYLRAREDNRGAFWPLDARWALGWALRSAVPVCLAVFGLLFYNAIRFDDWFDFGYVTINSAGWLMEAVRTYGMFNPHFLPANAHMMFLKLPIVEMRGACFYFSPTREGFSLFAVTPALIYLFRRLRAGWWAAGAWASVLLSVGLLLLYHNNGAWQLGYRYLMDFITPLLLLLAVGAGKRPGWGFIALAGASVLINAAAIIWWFEKWWC